MAVNIGQIPKIYQNQTSNVHVLFIHLFCQNVNTFLQKIRKYFKVFEKF